MTEQKAIALKKEKKYPLLKELGIALAGGVFLSLLSQVAIPLTPIPVTLQTFAVFLLGGILGSRRAVCSVLTYLLQGCCGLPVFAGGVSNPLWICTPQAGFLISFIAAAFIIGKLMQRKPHTHFLYFLGVLCLGQLIIFGIGGSYLALHIGWKKAFLLGVIPFITGAVLKILAGATGLTLWRKSR